MKTLLSILLLLAISSNLLFAWSDVSSSGSIEAIEKNPAAIAKRERSKNKDFIVKLDYSDSYEQYPLEDVDNFSYVNIPKTSLSLGFVGGNLAFFAEIGIYLDNKNKDTDGHTYYDFNNTTNFRFATSWEYNKLAFGATISGGNLSQRLNKQVDNGFDIVGNALFGDYEIHSGMENLQFGVGSLFVDGPYSVGLNIDKLLYMEDEEFKTDWDEMMKSLTLGASFIFNKYTSYGDLRLFRPRVFFEVANVTSSSCETSFGFTTTFQFLPNKELDATVAYVSISNGAKNLFDGYDSFALFELTYLSGRFRYGTSIDNKNNSTNVSLFLRYLR